MSVINRIHALLESQGKKASDLCVLLGIGTSTMSTWKKRETDPPLKYVPQICEFLNVSMEYLLTGDEKNTVAQIGNSADLSTDEADLLSYFRVLSRRNQRAILVQMENMINQENEQAATKQGKYLA